MTTARGGGKNPPSIEVGEVSFSEQDGTAKVEVRPSENTETWYWKCVPAGEEADYESVTGNEATTLDLTVTVDVDYVVSAYAENADGKSDVVTKDFKISSAELKGELVELTVKNLTAFFAGRGCEEEHQVLQIRDRRPAQERL